MIRIAESCCIAGLQSGAGIAVFGCRYVSLLPAPTAWTQAGCSAPSAWHTAALGHRLGSRGFRVTSQHRTSPGVLGGRISKPQDAKGAPRWSWSSSEASGGAARSCCSFGFGWGLPVNGVRGGREGGGGRARSRARPGSSALTSPAHLPPRDVIGPLKGAGPRAATCSTSAPCPPPAPRPWPRRARWKRWRGRSSACSSRPMRRRIAPRSSSGSWTWNGTCGRKWDRPGCACSPLSVALSRAACSFLPVSGSLSAGGSPGSPPPPRSSAVPSLLRSAAPRGKPRCCRIASPAPSSGGTGLGRGAGCLPLSGPFRAEKAAMGSAERLGVE